MTPFYALLDHTTWSQWTVIDSTTIEACGWRLAFHQGLFRQHRRLLYRVQAPHGGDWQTLVSLTWADTSPHPWTLKEAYAWLKRHSNFGQVYALLARLEEEMSPYPAYTVHIHQGSIQAWSVEDTPKLLALPPRAQQWLYPLHGWILPKEGEVACLYGTGRFQGPRSFHQRLDSCYQTAKASFDF